MRYRPGFGKRAVQWNSLPSQVGWSCTNICRSRLTMNACSSFSWTSENFVTGLCFHGSKIVNVSATGSLGVGAAGDMSRSMWYARGSGMPATSAMPHRGHLPGPLERMSGSMGQTYARSVEAGVFCGDAAVVVAGAGDGVREHAPVEIVAIRQTTMNARRMINCTVACGLIACGAARARAHDPSSVPITWNREISRVVYDRCASCHRPGGTAFSLMTYKDAQPRADAIRAAVMSRQMPPWGAVQGFGD